MSWGDEISDAIERSKSTGQICSVEVGVNVAQLEKILLEVARPFEMVEIEDNQVDAWGWSYETARNEQDWRLVVQCIAAEEMVA